MSGILSLVVGPLLGLIDKVVPDTAEATRLKAEIQTLILQGEAAELEAAAKIIVAEAQGSWLQRNWRPGLMVLFGFIIFNNFVLAPYAASLLGLTLPILDIPENMWTLIQIAMGGYVVSRGIEKTVSRWKQD